MYEVFVELKVISFLWVRRHGLLVPACIFCSYFHYGIKFEFFGRSSDPLGEGRKVSKHNVQFTSCTQGDYFQVTFQGKSSPVSHHFLEYGWFPASGII